MAAFDFEVTSRPATVRKVARKENPWLETVRKIDETVPEGESAVIPLTGVDATPAKVKTHTNHIRLAGVSIGKTVRVRAFGEGDEPWDGTNPVKVKKGNKTVDQVTLKIWTVKRITRTRTAKPTTDA